MKKLDVLHGISFALGVMVFFIGLCLLFAPDFAAFLYGLPRSVGDPVWQHVAGTRELTCGVLIMALSWTQQSRALGYLMLALSPIPLGDFVMAYTHDGGVMSLQHLPGIPVMLLLGVRLLRQSE